MLVTSATSLLSLHYRYVTMHACQTIIGWMCSWHILMCFACNTKVVGEFGWKWQNYCRILKSCVHHAWFVVSHIRHMQLALPFQHFASAMFSCMQLRLLSWTPVWV